MAVNPMGSSSAAAESAAVGTVSLSEPTATTASFPRSSITRPTLPPSVATNTRRPGAISLLKIASVQSSPMHGAIKFFSVELGQSTARAAAKGSSARWRAPRPASSIACARALRGAP